MILRCHTPQQAATCNPGSVPTANRPYKKVLDIKNSLVTYEIELEPGEELTLPESLNAHINAGRWLITIFRSHSAFLNSYAPQDEGLYDDYPPR